MEIPALYDLARQQNIEVIPFPLPENGSMSLMTDSGDCCIGIDPIIQDGTCQGHEHDTAFLARWVSYLLLFEVNLVPDLN